MTNTELAGRVSGGQTDVDDVDRAIIAALTADGRLSMRALAERVHISRAGAYARVTRLEESKVITGYRAVVDPAKIGYGVSAFVYVKVAQHSWKAVQARISDIPEVEHAALISGDEDLSLLVRTTDVASLRDLVLSKLQTVSGVMATKTVLILDEMRA